MVTSFAFLQLAFEGVDHVLHFREGFNGLKRVVGRCRRDGGWEITVVVERINGLC